MKTKASQPFWLYQSDEIIKVKLQTLLHSYHSTAFDELIHQLRDSTECLGDFADKLIHQPSDSTECLGDFADKLIHQPRDSTECLGDFADKLIHQPSDSTESVSYTHLRAHETG